MNKLTRILLYGNSDRSAFNKIYDEMLESNLSNLKVFTFITFVGMLLMLIASCFEPSLEKNRPMYVLIMVLCLLLFIISYRCQRGQRKTIIACTYVFESMMFAFGIALGTFIEPNEVSASFPILIFAVPLLFTDIPLRMNIFTLFGMAAYYVTAKHTQSHTMLVYNMSNIIPYGLIGMVVCTYMMLIKIRRYILENENRYLIETDQLTGMLNRRSYEQHLELIRANGCRRGTLFCTFDVNGLKPVNDTLGHHAGDELLCGASSCIEAVYGHYGHCYRIGGDEFIAILEGSHPAAEELRSALNKRCSCFKGVFVSGLSISVGTVSASDKTPIDELIKLADQEMYADKKRYYETTGIDRRSRNNI